MAESSTLSDEQMNVISGSGISGWAPVERPVGRQPLPDWVRGAHIDWMDGAANAPDVTLKVVGDVFRWPGQTYNKIGSDAYISEHADGRARVHYHAGEVAYYAAWRFFDGEKPMQHQWTFITRVRGTSEQLLETARTEAEAHRAECRKWNLDPRWIEQLDRERLEVKLLRATTQQDGYGGSHYYLPMADGADLVLRGPWHGGAPAGYVEVSVRQCDRTEAWARPRKGQPWYQRTGSFGLYITEDLFLRIVARYLAHVPMARVQRSYGERIEPYRAEWNAPKSVIYEQERRRSGEGLPPGPFGAVYRTRRGY